MGDHQQLNGQKAVEKLQEIVKHQSICMTVTAVEDRPGNTRPMSVAQVDDNGVFWFLTLRNTQKKQDVQKDPHVELYFANPSDQEFLAVHGRGEMVEDMAKKKELWRPIANAWVPDGVEDPNLTILKVTPEDSYYWDTKDGKVVAAIKIAVAMVTGSGADGGVEGKLRV